MHIFLEIENHKPPALMKQFIFFIRGTQNFEG